MNTNYTAEKHTQILIALLKAHGIKKVIASPGTTNICFVASIQSDPWFEIYSSVDERSAAYIACGMAAESGEPVALSCTGATASRNYVPGLTEAYYRNLPVLAITSSQPLGRVGNMYSQVVDRSQQMNDMVRESVQIEPVNTAEDVWSCELKINNALLALRKNGGGPAHINLVTTGSRDFSVKELPYVKSVDFIEPHMEMPSLNRFERIAILVGVHSRWSEKLIQTVDAFCEKYNAVVLMNHASNYKGKYGVNHMIVLNMRNYVRPINDADLVIYIGSIPRYTSGTKSSEMWRVSLDGRETDPEKHLTKVFQMDELAFFKCYVNEKDTVENGNTYSTYAKEWQDLYESIIVQVPELPFSNTWLAQQMAQRLPGGCVFHLAGSNTARAWNFFRIPDSVECYSNDGVMGIDGQVSALIGESLASPNRLHFGAVGDLTFFYDMNSLGNRHIGNNLRLLVVNNGMGAEFKIYINPATDFQDDANTYIAADGHYGKKSPNLIKHYAEDLGFEYLTANTKSDFLELLNYFVSPKPTEKPIIFEVFTDVKDESDSIYIMNHLVKNAQGTMKSSAKSIIKKVAGDKGVNAVKKILGR